MIILGIDAATKTGFAIWRDGRISDSGVMDFSKKRGETNGILFLRFRKWIEDMLLTVRPDLVIYEQGHYRGGYATELLVGLHTRILEAAAGASPAIEAGVVRTWELKKAVCGSARAEKSEMIEAAEYITGKRMQDDNEADAVAIAWWGAQNYETKARER